METEKNPGGSKVLSFDFFCPVADDLDGETESQGKRDPLPDGMVFHKGNDHHDKTKNADGYR